MTSLIPAPFLFRYTLPVVRVDSLPKRSGKNLLGLQKRCSLPHLCAIEGATAFGDVRVGWNAEGLGISVDVTGRTAPVACDSKNPAESDGLQVWIDTRNTQSIHRASRFCHHFCFLPADKTGAPERPLGVQLEIARAREAAELASPKSLSVAVKAKKGGYLLEAWLPAKVLTGFDPDANRRLGFYYYLRDSELGDQFLTVGHEFPFANDPSLWSTLELV